MKKKIIISILIVGLLIFGLWKFIFFILNKDLITAGNDLYGIKKCECNIYESEIVGLAFTHWKCELCDFEGVESHTGIPKLCFNCSKITKRCEECGKRLYFINNIDNIINFFKFVTNN